MEGTVRSVDRRLNPHRKLVQRSHLQPANLTHRQMRFAFEPLRHRQFIIQRAKNQILRKMTIHGSAHFIRLKQQSFSKHPYRAGRSPPRLT